MRSYLQHYEMHSARDLNDALDLMARQPGEWKPFAGGTDLMVLLEQAKLAHRKLLNILAIDDARRIEVDPSHVSIGALVTYTQLQRSDVLKSGFPLLCRAASETGSIANQNRGTLGGNIANASPAADSPPALLVYDAEVELASIRGVRTMPYANFHTGYKQIDLAPDEIVYRIRLPRAPRRWQQYYRKVGTRRAQAISKVCFAARADMVDRKIREIHIAMGSVAPTAVRCHKTEALLLETGLNHIREAQQQLADEIRPIDDFRSNARYRTRVAQNLLEEFLHQLQRAEPQ